MNIIQRLIPASKTKTRPGIKMVPTFITIHETDNTNAGADAEAHANLQLRGNDRTASWHLQVDDRQIIQSVPFDEVAWAAGDGRNGSGNLTSIHIEMCVNADGNYEKTVSNTVEVVQYLMNRYSIASDHIVPHKHWTGKNCPRNLLPRWNQFIKCYTSWINGWVKENGQWSFYKNGTKQKGWVKVKSKWYFLNESGVMQTGWIKDLEKWYFLDASGVMQTGWVKVNGKWYYLTMAGIMKTGWVKDKSKWYYMMPKGEMVTGWLKDQEKWYYLNPDGSMVTGTHTINGKSYTFSKDGALIEPENVQAQADPSIENNEEEPTL
ncbi:N-acetylmuramoyl-L-alanine amidase [Neobacillus drentensis]|uniref:N-acetylmuramoyl-L-alanine amidase n=1 Tax=Neobacillus drentensis TaxID=220684 RepID=UPI003000392F